MTRFFRTKMPISRFGNVGKKLGEGGFGAVYRLGDSFAVKFIENEEGTPSSSAIQEIGILVKTTSISDFTIPIRDFEIDDQRTAIVMPFAITNLASQINKGGYNVQDIFRMICMGVFDLHRNNVVHSDLKPENALRVEDRWMLSDFGVSSDSVCRVPQTRGLRGTIPYMSPEALNGAPASFPRDIWALGCILFELITRERLFGDENRPGQPFNTLPLDFVIPKLQSLGVDHSIIVLLTSMLVIDVSKRVTIVDVMNDPFVNSNASIPSCVSIHESFLPNFPIQQSDSRIGLLLSLVSRYIQKVDMTSLALGIVLIDAYVDVVGNIEPEIGESAIAIAASYTNDSFLSTTVFNRDYVSLILTTLEGKIHYSTPVHVAYASDTNPRIALRRMIATDDELRTNPKARTIGLFD